MPDEKDLMNHDDRETVCYVCHRTESKAGKMLRLPGGMHLCVDCLQKTMDTIEHSGMDINNMPFMGMPMTGMPFGNLNNPGEEIPHDDQRVIQGEVINPDGTTASAEE